MNPMDLVTLCFSRDLDCIRFAVCNGLLDLALLWILWFRLYIGLDSLPDFTYVGPATVFLFSLAWGFSDLTLAWIIVLSICVSFPTFLPYLCFVLHFGGIIGSACCEKLLDSGCFVCFHLFTKFSPGESMEYPPPQRIKRGMAGSILFRGPQNWTYWCNSFET